MQKYPQNTPNTENRFFRIFDVFGGYILRVAVFSYPVGGQVFPKDIRGNWEEVGQVPVRFLSISCHLANLPLILSGALWQQELRSIRWVCWSARAWTPTLMQDPMDAWSSAARWSTGDITIASSAAALGMALKILPVSSPNRASSCVTSVFPSPLFPSSPPPHLPQFDSFQESLPLRPRILGRNRSKWIY